MSNKKQTAMQDLRQDLIHTIDSAKDALQEIKNETTRLACQEVVRLTLKNIIQRIDDELLELEKQQIIDAYKDGRTDQQSKFPIYYNRNSEQYYNETFVK